MLRRVDFGAPSYAKRESPGFERAALRWLERYLAEGSPRLQRFAHVVGELSRLEE